MWPTLLKLAVPYVIAASVGFALAWGIQGVRLDASQNETAEVQNAFTTYHNRQIEVVLEKEKEQLKRQENTNREWMEKLNELTRDGQAYRRCVAAGKCGRLCPVPAESTGNGIRLPPASGPDESGSDAVLAAGEPAPEVIGDCAFTTLQLNTLQDDISRQRGYGK